MVVGFSGLLRFRMAVPAEISLLVLSPDSVDFLLQVSRGLSSESGLVLFRCSSYILANAAAKLLTSLD